MRQRADVSLRGPSSSDRKNVVPFELLSLRAGPAHSWHRSDQHARLGVPRGGGVTDQQTGATASLHAVFPAIPPVRLTARCGRRLPVATWRAGVRRPALWCARSRARRDQRRPGRERVSAQGAVKTGRRRPFPCAAVATTRTAAAGTEGRIEAAFFPPPLARRPRELRRGTPKRPREGGRPVDHGSQARCTPGPTPLMRTPESERTPDYRQLKTARAVEEVTSRRWRAPASWRARTPRSSLDIS